MTFRTIALATLALSLLTCGCGEVNSILTLSNLVQGDKQGPAGVDGAPGAQGVDGKDGAAGKDGKDGAPGPQGVAGPAGKDSVNHSGTRLKLRSIVGEDGSQIATGFHDTQLDLDCNYETLPKLDGHPHCYPTATHARFFESLPNSYADDGCNTPLVQVEQNYVFVRTPSMVYTLGEPADPQSTWIINDQGDCHKEFTSDGPMNQPGAQKPWKLLIKAKASTFVQGSEGAF